MKKFLKLIALLVIIPALSACGHTTIRKHSEFSKVFPKYNSVAVIPSSILINQLTKDGTKPTRPDPNRINNIAQLAQKELTAKGYTVTEVVSEDDIEEGTELSESYKKAVKNLYVGEGKDKEEVAFATKETIGKSAQKAAKSNSDLILLLGYEGSEMSQEQVTKNFMKDVAWGLIGVHNYTHIKDGSAVVGLIERKTGNVLWTNLGTDFEDYDRSLIRVATRSNVMENAFETALKGLPDKTKPLN